MTKNITVLDENGNTVGNTYPKRAKGLVKKSRAVFVTDDTICLSDCPTCYDTEDITMDNNININDKKTVQQVSAGNDAEKVRYFYLEPKKWKKHPDVRNTKFDRFSMISPFGDGSAMQDVLAIGDWGSNWCEITNGVAVLEKNTEYRFVFWLNGGENDRSNEVCQLHIIFTDDPVNMPMSDWENKLCFKLNRSYIKPIKRCKGWELYSIPFTTAETDFVQFRFVAQNAPMAVMAAESPDHYESLQDDFDPFEGMRPQRHNIVFEDGWPTNTWYATEKLRTGSAKGQATAPGNPGKSGQVNAKAIGQSIADSLDPDDIAEAIADHLDLDSIADMLSDRINIDAIAEQIKQSILESLGG